MLGIHPDGTLTFQQTFTVWGYIVAGSFAVLLIYVMNASGSLTFITGPGVKAVGQARASAQALPGWVWIAVVLAFCVAYPQFTGRYATDVAINVLLYICLGLGLNVVVGLAGMLDLGYIAFYGVGAYSYALLNTVYGLGFWVCLPFAAVFACIAGCIVGYPTLRMRGDYLAIVTLGFGEIIRLILNNWMDLTNGPNGILGIDRIGWFHFLFENGITFESMWVKKLSMFYYFALALAVVVIIGVNRLNFSRVGRAWESIREDETAAELMGVNTFIYKLLAYATAPFSPVWPEPFLPPV